MFNTKILYYKVRKNYIELSFASYLKKSNIEKSIFHDVMLYLHINYDYDLLYPIKHRSKDSIDSVKTITSHSMKLIEVIDKSYLEVTLNYNHQLNSIEGMIFLNRLMNQFPTLEVWVGKTSKYIKYLNKITLF